MTSPEDFFYDVPITVLKGPSLYLFNKEYLPNYRDSLQEFLIASKESPAATTESLYHGSSKNDATTSKLGALSGIDPKNIKIKWKHEDELTVPGISADVSYSADMVFVRLGRNNVQWFCLLTRLHILRESREERQRQQRHNQSKKPFSHIDYLTQKVVLITNARSQILSIFTEWLSQSFDALFKPIPLLSTEFMLLQYNRVFQQLDSLSTTPEELAAESCFIVFDTSAVTSYRNSLKDDEEQDAGSLSSSAINEITVSISGRDLPGFLSQVSTSTNGTKLDTLAAVIFHHYFNMTGINLQKLPIKKISTNAIILTSRGRFRIHKRAQHWHKDSDAAFWKFVQEIAEQR